MAFGQIQFEKAGQDKKRIDKYSLNLEEIHFAGTKFEMILYPDADHNFLWRASYGSHANAAAEDFLVKCLLK